MTIWITVLVTVAGCYLLKLAGYLVPGALIMFRMLAPRDLAPMRR